MKNIINQKSPLQWYRKLTFKGMYVLSSCLYHEKEKAFEVI